MRIKTINRYELKYLLHHDQARAVASALEGRTAPNSYAGEQGAYTITSLYFDTADYKAYWDKLEGHEFRRKVRVRVYGEDQVTPDTLVFLEIKQRLNRALEKRRVQLPHQMTTSLQHLDRHFDAFSADDRVVLEEVCYLANALQLRPACVVRYRRVALDGDEFDPGLRITFDTELKGRIHDLSLLSQGWSEDKYFVPPTFCIMEVKINHRVPLWLTEILGKHDCVLQRISKYCTALETSKAILRSQRIVAQPEAMPVRAAPIQQSSEGKQWK